MAMDIETPRRRRGRPRSHRRASVVAAVAARVGRGETLKSVFADREAGIPCRSVFLDWLAKDADLAEAYRIARGMAALSWTPIPGRPVRYNPVAAEAVCLAIADGGSLEEVCRLPGMPCQATIYRWLAKDEAFARAFGEARRLQAHRLFEQALQISEQASVETWRRDKLRIDTIRWTVAKLDPDRYGAQPKGIDGPPKKIWNVYLQQYGAPRESAELVQSYELNPDGKGRLERPDDADDGDWAL